MSAASGHVFLRGETIGKNFCQCAGLIAFLIYHIDEKIILAEFPHHLAADTAGRETAGDDAVLTTADSNGNKVPVTVIDGFEEGGALGAVGRTIGGVFDVAALVYGAVSTEQGRADLVAGVGNVGEGHGFFGQFYQFFRGHMISSIICNRAKESLRPKHYKMSFAKLMPGVS